MSGPFALLSTVVARLDDLDLPYALGGSMASSVVGEPRSTVDIDLAIDLDANRVEELIAAFDNDFYVPVDLARAAVAERGSFNLISTAQALKIDLFVLGDGILDRMQIQRRQWLEVDGLGGIWVTSPEDQVLRKLDWYRRGGGISDRQWRDIVGILRVRRGSLDAEYLRTTAEEVGLVDELEAALTEADG